MNRASAAAMFAIGLICGWLANDAARFMKSDACLDSGGAWDYQAEACRYK